MKISTRGRYAIRVMVNLAMHSKDNYIPLKEIADEEEISFKYIENIMTLLAKNDLIIGKNGKNGGYKLSKNAKDYTIGEILSVTENELAIVSCLDCKEVCSRQDHCKVKPMWKKLNNMIIDYFNSISLLSLLSNNQEFSYGEGI